MLNNSFASLLILFCFPTFLYFPFPSAANAQNNAGREFTYDKCFESSELEDGSYNEIASDNENLYVLSQPQGLFSFSRKNLNLNWKSDLGRQISNLLPHQSGIYLITEPDKKTDFKQIEKHFSENIEDNNNKAQINGFEMQTDAGNSQQEATHPLLWLINSITGFPVKKVVLPLEHVISLSGIKEGVILTGSDGTILYFDLQLNLQGKNTVINDLKTPSPSAPFVTSIIHGDQILILSGPDIITYNWKLNKITELLRSQDQISILAPVGDNRIVYGNKRGTVYFYNPIKNRIEWQYRTGAEILSVTAVKNGVLINSADNFLYFISYRGSLRWKKRFKDNPTKMLTDDKLIYLMFDGDGEVSVFETESGKTVSTINFPAADKSSSSIFLLKNLSTDRSKALGFITNKKIFLYYPTGLCH